MSTDPENLESAKISQKVAPKSSTSSNRSKSEDSEMIKKYFENCGYLSLYENIESKDFDISLPLYNCIKITRNEIINFLIKQIFLFPPLQLSFYLMQIIHVYLYVSVSQTIIFDYLTALSSQDLNFSLLCTWFLEAYLLGPSVISQKHVNHLKNLLNSILSSWCVNVNKNVSFFVSERSFITELILISRRLQAVTSKTSRVYRLHSELLSLDRSLSHPVFIPIFTWPEHVVVRIPYKDSSILNSKDKVPYLLYVEVIENGKMLDMDVKSLRDEEYQKLIKSYKEIDKKKYNNSECSLDKKEIEAIRENMTESLDEESKWEKVSVETIRDTLKNNIVAHKKSNSFFNPDDPSAFILAEPWNEKVKRIKSKSPFGNIEGWKLYSIIVKYGDDLRQDYLAFQFLQKCKEIWKTENVSCWVRPYHVVITESQAGIIEAVTDAVSIHQIKNLTGCSLEDYFRAEFGLNSQNYNCAKKEFVKSLAGYSLFQYIFQVKDRHNGNILMDLEGHIIHIDFGYILGLSPKNISFETSPFKISKDFLDLIEGKDSDLFLYFKSLMLFGFIALRKHMDKLVNLVEIMSIGDTMNCLSKKLQAIETLKYRFHADLNDDQLNIFVDKLISQSMSSFTTLIYDTFQYYTNGIKI